MEELYTFILPENQKNLSQLPKRIRELGFISCIKIANSNLSEKDKKAKLQDIRNLIGNVPIKMKSEDNQEFRNSQMVKKSFENLGEFMPSNDEILHFENSLEESQLIRNLYNQFLETNYRRATKNLDEKEEKENLDSFYESIDERLTNLPTNFNQEGFNEENIKNLRENFFTTEAVLTILAQEIYSKEEAQDHIDEIKSFFEGKLEKIGERINTEDLNLKKKRINLLCENLLKELNPNNADLNNAIIQNVYKRFIEEDHWKNGISFSAYSNEVKSNEDFLHIIVHMPGEENENLTGSGFKLLKSNPNKSVFIKLDYRGDSKIKENLYIKNYFLSTTKSFSYQNFDLNEFFGNHILSKQNEFNFSSIKISFLGHGNINQFSRY
jgi:hypothetical protein